ncbi:adenosylmethionine--8-amino-7-oxononanoate transaminase [uncultured Abyssibacter sp.]|uniref:adenosylmethionine--8-amino-7-oxononanoate transaminase n=1 Tax=uncultured Abyssibacter sp. TaxID=2320202 RepID=UPI0032B2481E
MSNPIDHNAAWARRDLERVWHPCTQMKDHEALPPLPIRSARGVWLEDFNGQRYIDAVSSWWVNLFGHSNPVITAALKDQLDTLDHIMLAGMTHGPAVELAEALTRLAPDPLTRCFYADNGSAAVEAALKMSFHYWLNRGETRPRFISLSNSYHGETLGALAVGDVPLYKSTYGPLLLDNIVVPGPDCFGRPEGVSWREHSEAAFAAMEETLERHAHEVSAVIVEPLVQCAGSMRMYDPVYLTRLREACDRHNVHLIADEIAVGFGRTGSLFACEQAGIAPDFMCLSKGITGGTLPLSVVLTSETVYQAFYDDYVNMRAFLHSHSYTGNALACRAALATLSIFESRDVLAEVRAKGAAMEAAAAELLDHPNVGDIRRHGMIMAIELVRDRDTLEPFDWRERRGRRIHKYALTQDVLLRPLGDVVYFMPPYVINDDEIARMVGAAIRGIDIAVRD